MGACRQNCQKPQRTMKSLDKLSRLLFSLANTPQGWLIVRKVECALVQQKVSFTSGEQDYSKKQKTKLSAA